MVGLFPLVILVFRGVFPLFHCNVLRNVVAEAEILLEEKAFSLLKRCQVLGGASPTEVPGAPKDASAKYV